MGSRRELRNELYFKIPTNQSRKNIFREGKGGEA
jgi:hypothetical protein